MDLFIRGRQLSLDLTRRRLFMVNTNMNNPNLSHNQISRNNRNPPDSKIGSQRRNQRCRSRAYTGSNALSSSLERPSNRCVLHDLSRFLDHEAN